MKTKILWDHTSIGSPVIFHPSLSNPITVLLKERTIASGCRHLASIGSEEGLFTATLGVDKSGEGLVAIIDKFDERADPSSFLLPGDIAAPCILHQRSVCVDKDTTSAYVCDLKALHRSVSSSSEVSLSRCLSLRLHLHLVGPNCKVQVTGMVPQNIFRAIPVPPLPLLNTALSESMSRSCHQSPKTGFLTMDMSQKLVLLMQNDPRIKTSPIIGIWVSGISTFVDPFVWASCLRFFSCPEYHKRVVRPEEPFLLVIYSTLHSSPEFYDVLSKTPKVTYSLLTGNGQLVVTKVPSFSTRVCSIDLHPTENSKKLKHFQDAEALLQKDLAPLPYCETAILAFPPGTEGYPPYTDPSPTKMNFILTPCVPDLSLLSEISQCPVQELLPESTHPRPPLKELNQVQHQPPATSPAYVINKVASSCSARIQENRKSLSPLPNLEPANPSAEPSPRPEPQQMFPSNNTLHSLRHKVEQFFHPVDKSVPVSASATVTHNFKGNKSNTRNPVHSGNLRSDQHCSGDEATDRVHKKLSDLENADPSHLHRRTKPDINLEEDFSKKFASLHQLLKQKDDKMQELQEQVRELLDLQRHQVAKPEPVPADNNIKLMSKIDKQNEELMKLKDQISLLLENQVREMSVSKATTAISAEMEKCSVGVMTSILVDSMELVPVSRRHSPRTIPLNQKLPGLTGVSITQTCSDGDRGTDNEHNVPQNNTRGHSQQELGNCCGCRCTQPDLSVGQLRIEPVNDTAVYSDRSLHLDLDKLQPPIGFSVDESLPLGASVSLLEGKLRKHHICHNDGRSSQSSSGSDHNVSPMNPRRGARPQKMDCPSRLSLPGRHWDLRDDDVLGQKRLSLGSDHHMPSRDVSPPHQWEGSILLPRLNYQTLFLSDDSDSESADATDRLSEKYLQGGEEGSTRNKATCRTSKKQIVATQKSECADLYSKNMSFATKEYLERYGLVS